MTDFPVLELIAQTLAARIATVTLANGYHYNIAGVVRPTVLGGYSPANLLSVLEQGDGERDAENDFEGNPNRIAWSQPFFITLFIATPNSDPTPEDQVTNIFAADVMKAITAPADWQHFAESGIALAFNAEFRSPKGIVSTDGAFGGTELQFVVHYRHPENDPYTVG